MLLWRSFGGTFAVLQRAHERHAAVSDVNALLPVNVAWRLLLPSCTDLYEAVAHQSMANDFVSSLYLK